MSLTPAERTLRARLAAHKMHSRNDSRETTAAARAAFNERWDDEVDPDRVLDPAERARRAEHARKAYFAKLAFASAKARKKAS